MWLRSRENCSKGGAWFLISEFWSVIKHFLENKAQFEEKLFCNFDLFLHGILFTDQFCWFSVKCAHILRIFKIDFLKTVRLIQKKFILHFRFTFVQGITIFPVIPSVLIHPVYITKIYTEFHRNYPITICHIFLKIITNLQGVRKI